MRSATEAEILEYASIVHEKNVLKDRTKESIEAFFRDAAQGYLDDAILRIGTSMHIQTTKSLLRQRELGYHNTRCHRLSSRGAFMEFRSRTLQTLGPSLSYTGTSGDVNTVAWAPDGVRFAAGSACLVDTASMQYNRPNNLLFGDMAHGTLQELPDHHTRRKKTETGVNATHSMYASQDQRLFQTVSMVDFSPDQEFMYTAGYDKKVRVWDIRNGVKDDPRVMKHKGKVDLLAVSKTGILATGTQRTTKAIKLMGFSRYGDSDILSELKASFSSQKALDRPENEIYPSALRFSPSGEHLLGGFSSSSHDEHVTGETCVWDVGSEKQLPVYPETRTVFDCAWHLLYRTLFAVGCVAGTNVNRGIRSVVRLYDWRADQSRYHRWMELDCEALDMNDIVYSPYDENLVAAGCTNSKTYIWDIRKPDNVMLTLEHGQPLMEFGEPESQEKLDTGIRFASWGHDRSCFYTGSSDGVLKSWNPYRATEDVHNRDIVTLNSGIMSGALSPDFSSLLLGEVNGSVNVLEVGQSDRTLRDMRRLKLMPAYESDPLAQLESTKRVVGEGVTAARDMISSDEITIKPMGSLPVRQAVQGPNYEGPHDKAPDAELLRARALHFQLEAKTTNQEQCEINGCREIDHVTSEEAGDSGRSAERIPGALHFASLSSDGKITGKAKCKKCGALTRPRFAENDSVDTGTLCERCSFACLSCANQAEVLDGATEFVGCTFCGGFWRADVLGYRALEKPKKERSVSVSSSRLRSLYSWGFEDDDETYMGSDCEEEYFQSLWSDRPSSPL
ncbi:uncharacterized protein K452DRAFT_294708 [Aplosporella prunicola CBS 121167]|uniref:Uncharacterized protein n=1 Tax=Aplosporella prunicola CBS 121167 TaxID=1176127 RepID=A0A6A6BRL4_9PEZI|nr:uncharacterized protein K452DRAFT_294708 [Aplosporella prunicola CBS 121167]KAF2146103.1 hypothetical protein K452DRAFT_294708 [Aplosporella prunicola CBS 121167]